VVVVVRRVVGRRDGSRREVCPALGRPLYRSDL
jgi:hypothetical protein